MSTSMEKPYEAGNESEKQSFVLSYITELQQTLDLLNHKEITDVLKVLEETFMQGKKIYIAGNGGSAATASHMASDLQKTTLGKKPQTKTTTSKFKAISLSDNIPVMTAWGNDEGYEHIFSQQLAVLGEPGDVLVIITGSGNSKNIIKAIEKAKEMGIKTVGFLGFAGGEAKKMVDHSILVDSNNFGPIEDTHMMLDHLITGYFKQQIQKRYEQEGNI